MNTAAAEEGSAAGRSTAVDLAAGTNMAAVVVVDIDLVGYMGVDAVVEPDCCSYHLQMMTSFADSVHQQIAIADQQEEEGEVVIVEEVAIFEWWACVVSALAPLHPKP